jgi:transcriptional regulator with XRE-family HTH domain
MRYLTQDESTGREFGKYLESIRGSMSLREASKATGLSHAYIRDLELNKNRSTGRSIFPSPSVLRMISKGYGKPYPNLLERAGYIDDEDVHEMLEWLVSKGLRDLG